MTPRDYIRGALSALGIRGAGQSLTGEQLSDGMIILNEMFDSWRGKGLMSAVWTRYSFAFATGQQTRTIGPGGQFDTGVLPRPAAIDTYAGIHPVGSTNEIPSWSMTQQEWTRVGDKSQTAEYPYSWLYEAGNGPLGVLTFFPTPTTAATWHPSWRAPLVGRVEATDELVFAEGYDEAIRTNLAIRLAPDYKVTSIHPVLMNQAEVSLRAIEGRNMPVEELQLGMNPYSPRGRADFDIRLYRGR